MERAKGDGSELHRLRPMKTYDEAVFNRLYRICRPVIRNLVKQIDARRYNVTSDIISSWFWDKMIFVFNKYYGEVEEEHLKANILRALGTYKLHLLKYAYNEKAVFNQSLRSLEDLFDNDKEFIDDGDDKAVKEEMLRKVHNYMRENLSMDAILVWEVINNPPPYIEENMKFGKITNILIAEFFDLPKTRNSVKYIGELREDIAYWMERASKELTID